MKDTGFLTQESLDEIVRDTEREMDRAIFRFALVGGAVLGVILLTTTRAERKNWGMFI